MEDDLTMNGTLEITFPGSACILVNGDPEEMNMLMDMTIQDDMTLTTIEFRNLSMEISNHQWIVQDEIEYMDILLNGTVAGNTDTQNFNIRFDQYSMNLTDNLTEENYTISMSGGIQTDCLEQSVVITTQEPLLFDYDLSCPYSGQYTVEDNGNTAVITIHDDTGIEIMLNDELVQTYATCEDVPYCAGL